MEVRLLVVFVTISIVITYYLYLRGTDLPKRALEVVNGTRDLTRLNCPDHPIVSVEAGGSLGSSMWEYASALVVARKLKRTAFVDNAINLQLMKVFEQLSLKSFSRIAGCNIDLGPAIPMEEIEPLDTLDQRYRGRHILLPAFIQLVETVVVYRAFLRKEFRVNYEKWSSVKETIGNVEGRGKNLVGVHVNRRDDFGANHSHLPTAAYYKNAMNWFREKIAGPKLFLVVTDDVQWCEENILDQTDVIMASKDAAHDLALMSECNHTIIDYGPYSFWSAFLSEGHTIMLNVENDVSSVMAVKAKWTIFDKDTVLEIKD